MKNPYAAYYTTQAGNGISGFTGSRCQRGHRFFGRIFSEILPVLKYLSRQVLSTGVSVAQDALQGNNLKETLKTSLKRRAADTFANIGEDASKRARTYSQTGTGYKQRKRKPKAIPNNMVKKSKPKTKRKNVLKKDNKRKNPLLF